MNIKKASFIVLAIFASAFVASCSEDEDSPVDDVQNVLEAGADHQYSLTFSGGDYDGQKLEGTIVNEEGVAAYVGQNGFQIVSLSMQGEGISITGVLQRQDNQNTVSFKEDISGQSESGAQFLIILNESYISGLLSTSGTVTISDFDTFNPAFGTGVAYFTIEINGTFEYDTDSGTKTTTVNGTLTINPPEGMGV